VSTHAEENKAHTRFTRPDPWLLFARSLPNTAGSPGRDRDGVAWPRCFFLCGVRVVEGKTERASGRGDAERQRCVQECTTVFVAGFRHCPLHSKKAPPQKKEKKRHCPPAPRPSPPRTVPWPLPLLPQHTVEAGRAVHCSPLCRLPCPTAERFLQSKKKKGKQDAGLPHRPRRVLRVGHAAARSGAVCLHQW
jgi:hypothetical protein